MKIPKTPGACADLLYSMREKRLKLARDLAEMEADEKALKEHLINTLPKSEATGVSGRQANVKVVTKEVPKVDDWDKVYAYVKKNNAWELLHRRVSDTAVKERWDAGQKVPGVSVFKAVTVSVTKL